MVDKIFFVILLQPDGVDWEEQLRNLKEENDNDDYSISTDKPGVR